MTPRDELRELLRPEREDDLRGLLADVVADTIDDPAPDAIDTLVALLRELGARVPSLPVGGGDGRHLLKISIDDGVAHSELICPERGCVGSSTCGQCGRDVDDTEAKPCYDCPDRPSPCWLQTWAENEDLTSYTADQPLGIFAIDATYDDELIVTILGPASSSAGDEAREALEQGLAELAEWVDQLPGHPTRRSKLSGGEVRSGVVIAAGLVVSAWRSASRRSVDTESVRQGSVARLGPAVFERAAHGDADAEREIVRAVLASLSSPLPGAGDGLMVQGLLNAVNNVLVWIANNDLPMDGDDQQEIWAMLDRWEQLTGLEHDERAVLLDGRYEPAPADDKETTR